MVSNVVFGSRFGDSLCSLTHKCCIARTQFTATDGLTFVSNDCPQWSHTKCQLSPPFELLEYKTFLFCLPLSPRNGRKSSFWMWAFQTQNLFRDPKQTELQCQLVFIAFTEFECIWMFSYFFTIWITKQKKFCLPSLSFYKKRTHYLHLHSQLSQNLSLSWSFLVCAHQESMWRVKNSHQPLSACVSSVHLY